MKNQPFLIALLSAFLLLLTTEMSAVKPVVGETPATSLSQKKKKKNKKGPLLLRIAEKVYAKKINQLIKQHALMQDSTRCDTLILRNGKRIEANIILVNDEENMRG